MTGREIGAIELARRLGLPHDPTAEQVVVIEAPLEPLLVIAGAGSGKTETMAARVVWLVANGFVRADEVLGLTFTRKAAGELGDRIGSRLRALDRGRGMPLGADRPRIATYNAYAGALVADHGLRLGVDPEARLLTEAGRWQLAAHVVETWLGDLAVDAATSTVTRAVLELAGSLAEHGRTSAEAAEEMLALAAALVDRGSAPGGRRDRPRAAVRDVVDSLQARARLMDLVEAFSRRKRERCVVDFADQVALAGRIAREVPEARSLERARYRVVLLDEYQDTSVAQTGMLRELFGAGHAVVAVGDPHQAIYGWRGASAGAIGRFAESFCRVTPDGATEPARVATLATSWRNDRAVLAVANRLAEPLRSGAAGAGNALDLPVLAARPAAGSGTVTAFYAETVDEENRRLAELVARAWREGTTRGGPLTAAVLCRARAQMPSVAQALRAAGLPVEVVGLGGLLGTPEVRDLHAALLVAHDPSRNDAAMRLLTGLRLGIADLDALAERARFLAGRTPAVGVRAAGSIGVSLAEAIDRPPSADGEAAARRTMSAAGIARVRQLGEALRGIRSQAYLPLPELVTAAERLLGLDIEVIARPGADPRHDRRHLDAFTEAAAEFARGSQEPTLGAFLAWLDAAAEYDRGLDTIEVEPDPTAVQVLTVHAAKGLEWDVVAVPGLVEGAFPAHDGAADPRAAPRASAWLTALRALPFPLRGDAADLPALDVDGPPDHAAMAQELVEFRLRCGAHDLAEERRLAYVAVTRARRSLILSGSWWKEAVTCARPPSRFLGELDRAGSLTSTTDAPTWRAPAQGTNPLAEHRRSATWPATPSPEQRDRNRRAAAAVERAAATGVGASDVPGPRASERARQWWADAESLLAEGDEITPSAVVLPAHLSASAVVRLVADPAAFAVDRRRPVPAEPTVRARRGSTFHAWVERYFGAAALLDVDDLPGADDVGAEPDGDLEDLQRAFLLSPWAARRPRAVEVDLETPVAGTVVRCRVDAVFDALPGCEPGGVEIVDWKTGPPVRDPAEARARQMQLAVYRLAWARLHGAPLANVGARFVHVAHGVEVVADPMGEETIIDVVRAAVARGGLGEAS